MNRIAPIIETWIGWTYPPAETAIERSRWTSDPSSAYCGRCGMSVGPGEATDSGCASCRGAPPVADRVVRLGPYDEPLAQWITAAKYERWGEMARALGRRLGERVLRRGDINRGRAIVVPIPMPWQRRLYRGIDHAAMIADGVARTMKLEMYQVLAKLNGPVQTALPATQRRHRRRDWMRIRRRWGGWPLRDYDIVLVDDVTTTGTTMRAAGRLLRGLGARRIIAAVIAITDEKSRRPARAKDHTSS